MASNKNRLGDLHFGGRAVELREDGRIFKPRTIFWEWLFLCMESPLRKNLHRTYNEILPDLTFTFEDSEILFGTVQKLELTPFSGFRTTNEAHMTGKMIGLLSWAGIHDLFDENIFVGRQRGKLIVAPIDIEALWGDFILPSQTMLFKNPHVTEQQCGLSDVIRYLRESESSTCEFLAALIDGYLISITELIANEPFLTDQIFKHPSALRQPIRVIPRPSVKYKLLVDGQESDFDVALVKSELDQLARGDIPYFFRYADKTTDLYFDACIQDPLPACLPKAIVGPLLDCPIISHNTFTRRNGKMLLTAGAAELFQQLSFSRDFSYSSNSITIKRQKDSHIIKWRNLLIHAPKFNSA